MGTIQRFWLKTVGSPSLGPADGLGTALLFLKRLHLSMLWRTSWLAEGLLLAEPAVITSARWSNDNSYHFWAFIICRPWANHFSTHRILSKFLWGELASQWPCPSSSPAERYDCFHEQIEKLRFRWVKPLPPNHTAGQQVSYACLTPMLIFPKLSWYGFSLHLGERVSFLLDRKCDWFISKLLRGWTFCENMPIHRPWNVLKYIWEPDACDNWGV